MLVTVVAFGPLGKQRLINACRTRFRGPISHAVEQDKFRPAHEARAGRDRMRWPLNPPLGKVVRIHDARHTCASWLLASGIPINYVQAHLGHESIKTTVDRYGHIMPAKRAALTQALSAALSASRPELVG